LQEAWTSSERPCPSFRVPAEGGGTGASEPGRRHRGRPCRRPRRPAVRRLGEPFEVRAGFHRKQQGVTRRCAQRARRERIRALRRARHARRPEGRGAADDAPDVAGVLDPVQVDHDAFGAEVHGRDRDDGQDALGLPGRGQVGGRGRVEEIGAAAVADARSSGLSRTSSSRWGIVNSSTIGIPAAARSMASLSPSATVRSGSCRCAIRRSRRRRGFVASEQGQRLAVTHGRSRLQSSSA